MSNSDVEMNPIFRETPEDLIPQILAHLPLETLLKFRSVPMLLLISGPNFAISQFQFANAVAADQIHVVQSYDYEDEINTLQISLFDFNTRRIVDDLKFPYRRGDFPCKPVFLLIGCDVGIVCVSCNLMNVARIYLWNPALKLSKCIPPYTLRDNVDMRKVAFGFGYDSVGNDFKVVRVVLQSGIAAAEVYSANENVWRNVHHELIDFPNGRNFDVCVNGFLFTSGKFGMIAFDLNTELFSFIKFPIPTFDDTTTQFDDFDPHARITEFKNSIAVIIFKRSVEDCKVNLWSLDDEACLRADDGRIEASWTLIQNIYVNRPVQFINGYFTGGDFLQLVDDVWYMYNSDNEEADFCIPFNENARNFIEPFYPAEAFRYRKSLFSIAGSTKVNWNAQGKKRRFCYICGGQ